jgi:hypothetical protein
MEINEQDYKIIYDPQTAFLHFEGTLRLIGVHAYEEIVQLLDQVVESEPPIITINMRKMRILNSSGITTLAKFVIKVNKKKNIGIIIQGSKKIAWQKDSLTNLKRLMPRLQLEWE